MDIIKKYFPSLTARQAEQYSLMAAAYREWNAKINVVSRKDIDNIAEHHLLHSLAIARAVRWSAGTRVLDFGCGGGLPGLPLAVMFPECHFTLIDGTAKKIRVCQEVAAAAGLTNVEAVWRRGEEEHGQYDYVVSRAVMPLQDMVRIVRKNISRESRGALPNGILTLKGGDLTDELRPYRKVAERMEISQWFDEPWFEGKNVIYLPI